MKSGCWQTSETYEEDATLENDGSKDASSDSDGDTDVDIGADADADRDADTDEPIEWHSFYGSTLEDEGNSIALDSNENIFITGTSEADWNGPANQKALNAFMGDKNLSVLKIDMDGIYQWHTFYGGEYTTNTKMKIDNEGYLYISGQSYTGWVGPDGQNPLYDHTGFVDDMVVMKLNSTGTYIWHTFWGAKEHSDSAYNIDISYDGSVFVIGATADWKGPDGQSPIHKHSGWGNDITLIKMDSSGTYKWHTFHGGEEGIISDDIGYCLSINTSGYINIIGSSSSAWNGPDEQMPINDHTGIFSDIVVLKLDEDGFYQWHTFYPANQDLSSYGITSDSNGNIYATWNSDDAWDGPAGQSPLHPHSGGATDIVILKLDSNGEYQWHTFYGSGFRDYANALTLDRSGNILVTGNSVDFWEGPEGLLPFNAPSSYENLFVLSVDPEGNYLWHSFYGGDGVDRGRDIATDNDDNIFVAGSSDESWNWPDGGEPLHSFSGGNDAVILKLNASL